MLSVENFKIKDLESVMNDLGVFEIYQHVLNLFINEIITPEKSDLIYNEICELIDNKKISVMSVIYILDNAADIRELNLECYGKLYLKLQEKYRFEYNIISREFRRTINKLGIDIEYDTSANPIRDGTKAFFYIAWNKVDDLINISQNSEFDFDYSFDHNWRAITYLDYACMFGSYECYCFLKLKGAQPQNFTAERAIQGGNKDIIIDLYDKGIDFSSEQCYKMAIKYQRYDVFNWLMDLYGFPEWMTIADCFSKSNFILTKFLIENGFDLNEKIETNIWIHQNFKCFIIFICSLLILYRVHHCIFIVTSKRNLFICGFII